MRHLALVALCLALAGTVAAQEPAAQDTPPIGFRGQQPDINPGAVAQDPPSMDGATVGQTQEEMSDLADQKQTLESELRYARAKLDAARQRLDVESMAGHTEEADKWEQEVKDWEGRVRALEGQLAQVDTEVQGAIDQMQPPAPQQNLILPGDNLEIFVVQDPTFNGRYQVRRGGYIIIPALGRIPVAGKTNAEAEDAVRRALEATQLQHADVMVEKVEGSNVESGPVIYLYGEFKNPRPFRIPTGTKATVVSVILSSGGVSDQADLTRVKVMRVVANKSVVEEENVERILDGSGLTSDLTLSDGNVIVVPAGSANQVYITGKVIRATSLPLKPGDKLTVYAAILDCGGFSRFADLKKVFILRAEPDGTKTKIHVNIIAIQQGRAPDVPLQGDDIVVVPEKFWSW